jgi:SAM-dependent methyltransferase
MTQAEAVRRGYRHKNLLFWLGMLDALMDPILPTDRVIDWGCGHGLFLQLLYEVAPYRSGAGVERDKEALATARRTFTGAHPDWPIAFHTPEEYEVRPERSPADVIFCQEIIWMNSDLPALAATLHRHLRDGGCAYATMGSHPGNPLWAHRKGLIEAGGAETHSYTLDEVARVFAAIGFAVGLRRLPIPGFVMYHPDDTPRNARLLEELVHTTTEHKMLFYFGKGDPVTRSATLQG